MANNLKDHLKEVADAIRAKKGTSDLINPQDFATEIEGITSGGSTPDTPSGESDIEYLDITNAPSEGWLSILLTCSLFVKQEVKLGENSANSVFPTFQSQTMRGDLMGVNQLAIDLNALVALSVNGIVQTMTVAEFLTGAGATQEQLDAIPRITKEQFYDLNA
jgi:hypothetical protein